MDLAAFFNEVAVTVAPTKGETFPGFPVSDDGHGNGQTIDGKAISRISRISRDPEGGSGFFDEDAAQAGASAGGRARTRDPLSKPREMREQREMPAGSDTYISRSLSKKREIEKETGNPLPLPGAFQASAPASCPTFDERAAFLEYECGLSRAEAEAQATSEALPDLVGARPESAGSSPPGSAVARWTAGLALLSSDTAPCPDYRGTDWPRVYANALAFLDGFGAQAEALGWKTHELFGVHPEVGTGRPDHCGALVLTSGGAARAITADTIRFDRATYRRAPGQSQGVPIWEVGR